MKVVGVISSARRNGNTATLVREALKGAEKEGAAITEIFLPKYRLDFCTGCLKCLSDGKCPIQDDFMEIRDLLYGADGIIWGSPTYGGTMNAIMKNLFDRLGMYTMLTSSLGGKYAVGISTATSVNSAKKVAGELAANTSSHIFVRGYVSGVLAAGYVKNKTALEDKDTLNKAWNLGSKMAKDIKNGKRYPLQNLLNRLIYKYIVKSKVTNYIVKEKESDTKAVYNNLLQRNLIKL